MWLEKRDFMFPAVNVFQEYRWWLATNDRPEIHPLTGIDEENIRVWEHALSRSPAFKFMQSPSSLGQDSPGFSLFTCQPVIRFATTCCLPESARGKAKFEDTAAENRVNKPTGEIGRDWESKKRSEREKDSEKTDREERRHQPPRPLN